MEGSPYCQPEKSKGSVRFTVTHPILLEKGWLFMHIFYESAQVTNYILWSPVNQLLIVFRVKCQRMVTMQVRRHGWPKFLTRWTKTMWVEGLYWGKWVRRRTRMQIGRVKWPRPCNFFFCIKDMKKDNADNMIIMSGRPADNGRVQGGKQSWPENCAGGAKITTKRPKLTITPRNPNL